MTKAWHRYECTEHRTRTTDHGAQAQPQGEIAVVLLWTNMKQNKNLHMAGTKSSQKPDTARSNMFESRYSRRECFSSVTRPRRPLRHAPGKPHSPKKHARLTSSEYQRPSPHLGKSRQDKVPCATLGPPRAKLYARWHAKQPSYEDVHRKPSAHAPFTTDARMIRPSVQCRTTFAQAIQSSPGPGGSR